MIYSHIGSRPFQILQEKESIAAYGLICDRLVMMVLRTFCRGESEGRSESDGESGKESSEESEEESEEESGREGESNSLRDGECDSEQAGSEGERESDYVSSDNEDLDEWGHGENENETNHRNSTYTGDISHREDQANEAEGYDTPSHSYPVTLHPTVLQCAKRLRDRCRRPLAQSSQKSLQQAYHSLVLATFTTKTDKGHFPLHSLMDGFVMSISIDAHLRFVPAHLISSHLAKVIYSALFSMLVQVLKTPDPYQTFVDTLQRWIKPGMGTPFCSVRRYTRLCYAICRSHIALPRLQFASAHSPEFKFDGKKLSVISMIQMYHAVYSHMVDVLRHRLLFGANDAALQPLKKPGDLVDWPHIQSVGQGVLVSEMHACWAPMKIIVDNTRLRQKYFIQASNGKLLPRIEAWEEYVEDIEVFKEHFYFLFHQLSGMPKRGTEEIRAKIVDTSFRGRNLMYLFERLACVGDYNKSSRNTGNDKLTLHFLPRPLEYVLRRFQASVAAIGAWAVDVVLDTMDIPKAFKHPSKALGPISSRWH
ncbi:hypothetical protein BDR06DRAFT_1015606 [Suillus hirtellus]|nr:hypothetical protein BDR06DRAFT_1015606 [Suillus hirtellus]